jgi:hypothetical protein
MSHPTCHGLALVAFLVVSVKAGSLYGLDRLSDALIRFDGEHLLH